MTESVANATNLALIVYVMAAAVSFLVACIIRLTFAVIRMHSSRSQAQAEKQAQAGSGS